MRDIVFSNIFINKAAQLIRSNLSKGQRATKEHYQRGENLHSTITTNLTKKSMSLLETINAVFMETKR